MASVKNPICDFCSSPNPRWRYAARDIQVAVNATSLSDWLACDECARLIGNEDWDALARRSLKNWTAQIMRSQGISESELVAQAKRLHEAFRQARTGAPPSEVVH